MDFKLKFPCGMNMSLLSYIFPSEAKTRNCISEVKYRIFVSDSANTQAFRWASPILLKTGSQLQSFQWARAFRWWSLQGGMDYGIGMES